MRFLFIFTTCVIMMSIWVVVLQWLGHDFARIVRTFAVGVPLVYTHSSDLSIYLQGFSHCLHSTQDATGPLVIGRPDEGFISTSLPAPFNHWDAKATTSSTPPKSSFSGPPYAWETPYLPTHFLRRHEGASNRPLLASAIVESQTSS